LQKARDLLEIAAEKHGDDPETQNALARMLAQGPDHRLRVPAQAVEWAKKAVKREPKFGPYWSSLGLAFCRAGDWRSCVESISKAIELRNGGEAVDWLIFAMAHWREGDKDQARRWYDKGVKWMDENDPKNCDLGRLRDEAAGLLGLADSIMPNGTDAFSKPDADAAPVRSGAAPTSGP
jgi:tetratricopeptide (TPR) repeat protein